MSNLICFFFVNFILKQKLTDGEWYKTQDSNLIKCESGSYLSHSVLRANVLVTYFKVQ